MDSEKNDRLRLGLGLGLGSNDDYNPKKREVDTGNNSNKRKVFLGLSIPLDSSDHGRDDDLADDSSSNLKDEDDECKLSMDSSCRKKLRLTRDQTTLLEDSFKLQTTLNTAQKQALAEKLNLKPRQVEVWFQNRRARTKLKQTEVDCEFLRKNCERLSEENWRLKKELLELRSLMRMENPPPAVAGPQFLYHNHKAAAAGREKQ